MDRHVGWTAAVGICGTWLFLLALFAVFQLIREFDDVGQGDYDLWAAAKYVALTLPRFAYDLFPAAALIGALLGLGTLAQGSELVAYRAAGASRRRLILAIALGASVPLLTATIIGEWLAPAAELQGTSLRISASGGDEAVTSAGGLWLRKGDTFIYGRRPLVRTRPDAPLVIEGIEIYRFADGRLQAVKQAKRALHEQGEWTLERVNEAIIRDDGMDVESRPLETVADLFDPELLQSATARPRQLGLRQLALMVDYLDANGLDASRYSNAYWYRLFYPATALSLLLIATPFLFGPNRSAAAGQRLFIGVAIGVCFFLLSRAARGLIEIYAINPMIGALMPALVLLATTVVLLKRQKT